MVFGLTNRKAQWCFLDYRILVQSFSGVIRVHVVRNREVYGVLLFTKQIQWNLSVTTTSKIKFINCDLFNNVF